MTFLIQVRWPTKYPSSTVWRPGSSAVSWYGLYALPQGGQTVARNLRRAAPYGTLFSNIDTGHGLRVFSSAGAVGRGAHAGALTTFWNVRASRRRNRCAACDPLLTAHDRTRTVF